MSVINDINKAISQHLTIEIVYEKSDGSTSNRRVGNLCISQKYPNCIDGFCYFRKEIRTFRIDRIRSVQFVEDSTLESINSCSKQRPTLKRNYQFDPNKSIFKLYGKDYNQ
jgi:predicted DNA-binding transcriptional regulator YafY